MNKTLLGISLLLLLVSSCSNFTFKDLKDFDISEGLLEDGEKVKVIYNSGAPDENLDVTYYQHLIVVSQISGDTINVLSPGDAIATEEDPIRYFIDNRSSGYLIMQNLDKIQNGMNINELSPKDIQKVVVNNTTSGETVNNFPTVIGNLANDIRPIDLHE